MAYCSECGTQLFENEKFCHSCGVPVRGAQPSNIPTRTQEYAGTLIKCPNCGESLASFATNCPVCGYELRGAKASNSVRELATKLESIEATREQSKPISGTLSALFLGPFGVGGTRTDEQKISLIRSFPIPNTKEDLREFFILAASNISEDRYDNDNMDVSAKKLSDAWQAKYEQAYKKAKISFGNTSEFTEIEALYREKSSEIKGNRIRSRLRPIIGVVVCIGLMMITLFYVFNMDDNEHKKIENENKRLDGIVEEVYTYIDTGKYDLARAKASRLVFSDSISDGESKKWDKVRIELIEMIDEASEETEKEK